MANRGTAEFYREQAARLKMLAADAHTSEIRLELLEMAVVFQRLAERFVANGNLPAVGAESA